jgi:hypothetical protein
LTGDILQDFHDEQEQEQQKAFEFVKPRLERAERAYNQALTSLWLGNGGATVAVLSFIGAAWRQGTFPHQLLYPLWCFILGLISMGAGAALALIQEGKRIKRMLQATSWLHFKIGDIQNPAEEVGLSFRDWRTRMAVLSAGLFVLGCLIGAVLLTATS